MAADPFQPWLEMQYAGLKREDQATAPSFDATLHAAKQRGASIAPRWPWWRAVAAAIVLGGLGVWLAWSMLGPGHTPTSIARNHRPTTAHVLKASDVSSGCPLLEWQSPTRLLLEPPGQWPMAQDTTPFTDRIEF